MRENIENHFPGVSNMIKTLYVSILSLCLLIGCSTTPEPGPRTIAYKAHDEAYYIRYPNGAEIFKGEAYWLVYSDGSAEAVSKEEWDKYDVPVLQVIEADMGYSVEKFEASE